MQKIIAILIISLLLVSTSWARGAYTWVDDDGVVHYSDRTRGNDVSVIKVIVNEPKEPTASDPQAAGDKPDTPAVDALAAARDKKIRKENCVKAKEQLETNQSLTRMYRVIDGERHYLSEKERDEVIKRSHEAVSYWCQ